MNTTPTASSTDEVTPAQTKEQGDDRYWIDHYRSVSSAVERTSTPASQDTKPHPRSPKRSATANPVKLTIFPPILNPNSASTPSPPTPDKDTSKAENDKLISIYPSEIISPSSSGPSDRNSAESPLKTVRFARTHIYHSSDSIITPTSLANYLEVPFTTATTLTRTQSDPKRERKGKHRADIKSRMTSDPLEIDITTGRSLPLRGDIPVRKMSSRSGSSKREERERSNSLRTREYGPPNVVRPIRPAARDLETLARIESSLILQSFTSDDAWALGSAIRTRLFPHTSPTTINIALSSGQVLFHCTTKSGTTLDNTIWTERKRNTVLRWGVSTWYLNQKYGADESLFAYKNGLGEGEKSRYALRGGGFPIRVEGVEGVVAVVVVCGLRGEEDHEVIVETIQEHWY